jgi:hypothetical protein
VLYPPISTDSASAVGEVALGDVLSDSSETAWSTSTRAGCGRAVTCKEARRTTGDVDQGTVVEGGGRRRGPRGGSHQPTGAEVRHHRCRLARVEQWRRTIFSQWQPVPPVSTKYGLWFWESRWSWEKILRLVVCGPAPKMQFAGCILGRPLV